MRRATELRNVDYGMRPEPRGVQGSHAPNVVHGGLKKKAKKFEIRNSKPKIE